MKRLLTLAALLFVLTACDPCETHWCPRKPRPTLAPICSRCAADDPVCRIACK